MAITRPRRPKGSTPARSVRVSDEAWEKARSRAEYEGVTVSHVAAVLIEGYSKGLINMPKVQVVYEPPSDPQS